MSQIRFNKNRDSNKPKDVAETTISKPEETYKSTPEIVKTKNKRKTKKLYSTIRVERENVHELNALQNSLGFDTQNEFLEYLLDNAKDKLSDRQRTMFNMYMDTYEARDRRKS